MAQSTPPKEARTPQTRAVRTDTLTITEATKQESLRHNRLRTLAKRNDLRLEQCRTHNTKHPDYHTFRIKDASGEVVHSAGPGEYGLTLGQVEQYLTHHALTRDAREWYTISIPLNIQMVGNMLESLLNTLNQYYALAEKKNRKGIIWMFYDCPECATLNWTANLEDRFNVCIECGHQMSLPEV